MVLVSVVVLFIGAAVPLLVLGVAAVPVCALRFSSAAELPLPVLGFGVVVVEGVAIGIVFVVGVLVSSSGAVARPVGLVVVDVCA